MIPAREDTESSLITVFGKNVRYRRKWRRWTQEDLAERANLHPMAISQIERGATNPRLGTVQAIAEAFKLDPTTLLDPARSKTGVGN